MNGPFNDQGPTGWNPPLSDSDFKPVPLPLGAATPAIHPPPNHDSDTLVDIAKKLERVIELLEKHIKIMEDPFYGA